MATDLTGLKVKDTYNSLLKIGDNSSLSATPDRISDGLGNESALWLSTARVGIGSTPDSNYTLTVSNNIKTQSLDASSSITASSLRLTGGAGTQGLMSWNTDEETIDVVQNGAVLQLGQETHVHVKNQSGATINDGTPVYVTGTLGSSGRLTVAPMIADGSIEAKYFLGVTTEDIPNGEDGKVTTFGKIRGLNTSAYSEGQTLYVSASTAGYWQTTAPVAPNLDLEVAIVINVSANNGTIFVRAQNGHYLGLLHDVYISSPANNQFLVYNSTTSRWENQGIASVGSINLDSVTDNGNTTTNNISVGDITAGNMTLSGYLRGAANFVIDPAAHGDETGVVQILGDLRVDGTTTTINSTTVTIDDKNIVLASGSATAADANGAGITIDGASATMTYVSASDRFVFNKNIETDLVGNADTASTLETARNIAVDGAVTGNADFDGSANITITTAVNHNHDDRYYTETEADTRFVNVDGDTMTGDLNLNGGVLKVGNVTTIDASRNIFANDITANELFATSVDFEDLFLTNASGGSLVFRNSQGNTVDTENLATVSFQGYYDSAFVGASRIQVKANEDFSATARGTVINFDFWTTGSTYDTVAHINSDGLFIGTTNVYDNLPTGISWSKTDNRFKIGVTKNTGGTTETAIDDLVLATSMDADYIPYVSSAGGDGDTVNAVLSQSWLKLNSDTLEIGNVSDPFSVDSKIIKISRQIAPNEKQITEFKAQGVFVTSTTATYGTKNSSLQFYTNGRLNVNGSYTLPEGDGTSGQVLSTNGSGDLSWVAAGGPTTSDLQDVTDNGNTTTNSITVGGLESNGHLSILDTNSLYLFDENGAKINLDARGDGTGAMLHKWNRRSDDTAYNAYYENWYDGNSYHQIGVEADTWRIGTRGGDGVLYVGDLDASTNGALDANKQGIVIQGTGGRVDAAQDGTERLPTLQFFDSVPNYGSGTATAGELRGGVEWYTSETSSNFPAISGAIYSVNENTYNTQMGLGFFTAFNTSTPEEVMRLNGGGGLDLKLGNYKVNGTTVIDSSRIVYASSVRVTNIVTNRIVKFDGTDLDDSIMTDDGSSVSVAGDLSATGTISSNGNNVLTTATSFGGDVSGTYNNLQVTNDSHTHDGRYYTEGETDTIVARSLGWIPAYSNTDENTVQWNDTEQAVRLYSSSDTQIGMAYKAIRMKAGDKARFTVMAKSAFAATQGLYVRLYFYSGDLPDGKTHVSHNAATSSVYVQEDDFQDAGWYENGSLGTAWQNFERTYTAPADGYVSLVILNWTGLGTGAIYVKQPDIQFEKVNQATSSDLADQVDIIANDTFSGTYPIVWRDSTQLYSSTWMTVTGATDTLNVPNIYASSKVSIGTTATDYPLNVGADSGANAIRIIGRSDNIGSIVFANNANDTNQAFIQSRSNELRINPYAGNLKLYSGSGERIDVNGDGIIYMARTTGKPTIKGNNLYDSHLIIDSASSNDAVWLQNYNSGNVYMVTGGGSVGIGLTSVGYKLHVNGDAKVETNLTVGDSGQTNTYLYLLSSTSGTSNLRMGDTDTDAGAIIYSNNSNLMTFRTNAGNRVFINSSGFMGIGYSNPASALVVKGNAQTLELRGDNHTYMAFYRDNATRSAYLGYGSGSSSGFYLVQEENASLWLGTNGAIRQTILNNGNIGINNTAPAYTLDVGGSAHISDDVHLDRSSFITMYGNNNAYHGIGSRDAGGGTADDIRINSYGAVYVNLDSNNNNSSLADFRIGRHGAASGTISSWLFNVDGETGAGTFSGDVIAFGSPSDISLKENIKPIEGALDKVKKLQGVTFDWKQNDDDILKIKEDYGFIAQEVQEVLPELVRENENGKLSLRDKGIISVLVEAVKEQQKQIEQQQLQIDELKARLDA